jgi:hypothetical protein
MYTKAFLSFYGQVEKQSIFHHHLYIKDRPASGMLLAQDYYTRLLDGSFMETYQISNKSIITSYENMEKIQSVSEQEVIDACCAYKPLPNEKALSLPAFFFMPTTHFSLAIEHILNPLFSSKMMPRFYATELELVTRFESCVKPNTYKQFIEDSGFPDNYTTKKKVLAVYDWWLTFKDGIEYFAESDILYQKTFKCLLDHYVRWYESWRQDMAYNAFGAIGTRSHNDFIRFCEQNGYYVNYDKKSWKIPSNRKILYSENPIYRNYDIALPERIQALGSNSKRLEAYILLESKGLAKRKEAMADHRPESWDLLVQYYNGEL